MEWLIALLILLVFVTLIGHGIWVFVAWVFRGSSRRLQGPPRDELGTAADQVRRLFKAGLIGADAFREVMGAIDVEQRPRAGVPAVAPPSIPAWPIPVQSIESPAPLPPPLPPAFEVEPATPTPASEGSRAPAFAAEPAAVPAWHPQPVPPPPPAPRRPWSEVLAAFMEQRNIRWGELVGGLLIVGCSVALVLSFWAQIAERPILKFSVFTAVTGALFGLGLYTEHRWKLPSTSRGVLLIATLLVPLNFLAFAALTPAERATYGAGVAVAGQVIAFGLFLGLAREAAKVIAPQWPGLLTAGLMSLSASSLAVRYLAPVAGIVSTTLLYLLAGLPLACYGLACGAMLARARHWPAIDREQGNAVLTFLGVLTFAAVFPLALLAWKTGDAAGAARDLAPLLSLAGLPALAAGLLLWRRVEDPALARLRTTGTAVGILGAAVLLAGIPLAWPDPARLLPVAVVDALALTFLALRLGIPAAHWLAVPCALLAYLLGFHLVAGHVGWADHRSDLWNVLLSPSGGTALAGLTLALAAAGEGLTRLRRSEDARAYRWAAAGVAAVSLALAGWAGFGRAGDPYGLTWLCGAYAVTAFAVAWRWRTAAGGWAGWALLLTAAVQWLVAHDSGAGAWTLGLLAYATAATAGVVAARSAGGKFTQLFGPPSHAALVVVSAAVVVLLGWSTSLGTAGGAALRACWLAGLWLAIAASRSSPGWFLSAQAALAAGVALAVVGRLNGYEWFVRSANPLLEPWTLQAVGIALALLGIAWSVARRVLTRETPEAKAGSGWLDSARALVRLPITVDHLTTLAAGVLLLGLAVYAAAPGVAAEFARPGASPGAMQPPTAHLHAAGAGSWVLLATMLAALMTTYWEERRAVAIPGALIVLWAACPLLAAQSSAAASAVRWCAAGYLLAGAAAVEVLRRTHDSGSAREAGHILLLLGVLPIVALSAYPTALALGGDPAAGPAAESVWARLGTPVSYAVPLLVVAGLLVAQAVRRRSDSIAFAALATTDLTVTVVYVLSVVTPVQAFGLTQLVRLAQLNVAATAAFALAWLVALARTRRREPAPRLLAASVAAGVTVLAVLVLPAAGGLFVSPVGGRHFATEVGGAWGWLALALSAAAVVRLSALGRGRASLGAVAVMLPLLAAMAACGAAHWERGNWVAYHTWMAAHTAAAWAMLGLGWWLFERRRGEVEDDALAPAPPLAVDVAASGMPASPITLTYQRADAAGDPAPAPLAAPTVYVGGRDVRATSARWAIALGVFSVLLALRAMIGDPAAPWWSVGAALAVGLLTTAVAWWLVRPGLLYASTLLLNLAATLFCLRTLSLLTSDPLAMLLQVNVIVLALGALAWLVVDLAVLRPRLRGARVSGWPPVHHAAAVVSLATTAFLAAWGLSDTFSGARNTGHSVFGWAAFGATAALLAGCLWDNRARFAPAGLHTLGLVGLATLVGGWDLTPQAVASIGTVLLGAYAVGTSGLYAARRSTGDQLSRSGLPLAYADNTRSAFLVPANLLLVVAVLALAFWCDFTLTDRAMRLAASAAAVAQVATLALLARDKPASGLRPAALAVGTIAAVALAWAWPGPIDPENLRAITAHGAIATGVLITAAAASYAAGFGGRHQDARPWPDAARTITPAVLTLALGAMLLTLGAEVVQFVASTTAPKKALMHPLAIGTVIAALGGACAAALWWALSPARDPLRLSERGRVGYVYAAEALAALCYLHVKLTCPPILPSFFNRFWPLALMAVAFAGVGLGEVFRRQGRRVLYEPFERTGMLLPPMLLLAFWFAPSQADYSGVLLAAGAVYAAAAVMRRSFTFALLAALAGNGALWFLLYRSETFGFFSHPQAWVIPAALSALAAAQLNRDRLSAEQLRLVRYLSLVAVYVSSTADILLNRAAPSPWLPLALAALSVAGVLAGVLFRIRPFLFLGTAFLAVSVGAMIWNAQANLGWTWLWYVAGIVLGLMILALFALFEKKREEMIALVEGLRAWE